MYALLFCLCLFVSDLASSASTGPALSRQQYAKSHLHAPGFDVYSCDVMLSKSFMSLFPTQCIVIFAPRVFSLKVISFLLWLLALAPIYRSTGSKPSALVMCLIPCASHCHHVVPSANCPMPIANPYFTCLVLTAPCQLLLVQIADMQFYSAANSVLATCDTAGLVHVHSILRTGHGSNSAVVVGASAFTCC